MAKEIKVRIATDQTFRSLYWSYSFAQLKRAVLSATGIFERQFPEVRFKISAREENWDSRELPLVRDFPLPLILDLPKHASFARVVRIIGERMKKLGFRRSKICDKKGSKKIIEWNKGKSRGYKFWYLIGYLEAEITDEALANLRTKVARERNEIVLGFTGNFFFLREPQSLGWAELGGNYAVFLAQYQTKLPSIVLHEIGHLFGAKEVEGDEVSVMNSRYLNETSKFDPENIRRIHKRMAEI